MVGQPPRTAPTCRLSPTVPEISVVIASFNRAARLQACLLGLAAQSLPAADFEVIVVVDGSTDNTRAMLAALVVPYTLNVLWQSNQGQCPALNRGAAAAQGRYLLFLDDDITPAPGLVAAHLSAQRAEPNLVGLGQIRLTLPAHADEFARAFGVMWTRRFERLNRGDRAVDWMDGYSGNLSVERALFHAAGGFATGLEAVFDVELAYRLHGVGAHFAYLPAACGDHDDYKDFYALVREAERQGRAAVAVWRRHPTTLGELLGGYAAPTLRQRALRGLLLTLNAGPRLLALLSRVVPKRGWATDWYAFVHQYFFWRGVRAAVANRDTWARLTYQTPILMYHAFAAPGEPASRFVLSGRVFAAQLTLLRWLGYRVIALDEYVAARRAHTLTPDRAVILTIDDGYADNVAVALPVLRRLGATATVFIVSGRMGGVNDWDTAGVLAGRPLLNWAGVQALSAAGQTIGAHTPSHPHLSQLTPAEALAEMEGSRADLERALGAPVRLLTYPYGDRTAVTRALAAQAGFEAACSVRRRPNSPATPLYELHRLEVFGTDSLLRFSLGLWLGDENLPPRRRPTV